MTADERTAGPSSDAPSSGSFRLRARSARNVRRLRGAAGVTQQAIAEHAGLHLRHYQRIQDGDCNVTVNTLAKLARAFEVDGLNLMGAGSTPKGKK